MIEEKWISVKIELPQKTGKYVCKDIHGNVVEDFFIGNMSGVKNWLSEVFLKKKNITHLKK